MKTLALGDFLSACGDAGADCMNTGAHFDDALRARIEARRAQNEQADAGKLDVDRLVNAMGMSNFRRK